MAQALGFIEALGLSTAMVALDAATKCADVTLVGSERVIGAGKMISVTLCLEGDVAAVEAAVAAGRAAGGKVGTVFAARVIPRPHDDLDLIFSRFEKRFPSDAEKSAGKASAKRTS